MPDHDPVLEQSTARIRVGDRTMEAFVAMRPRDAPSDSFHPPRAVLVLNEAPSFEESTKALARRLAAAGHVAIAPDVRYGIEGAAEPSREEVAAEMLAAIAFARSELGVGVGVGQVAALGVGRGGFPAVLAACRSDLSVAIVVYGVAIPSIHRTVREELGSWVRRAGPVRVLVGAEDARVRVEQVAAMEASLSLYRVPHDVVVYPRTGEGFLNEASVKFRSATAEDAWARILAWLSVGKGSKRQRRSYRL